MNHPVAKDFMWLTRTTCPHGHEHEVYGAMLEGLGFSMDEFGNYWLGIPTKDNKLPDTMFAAHLDTADYGEVKKIKRVVDKGGIVKTDGKTLLGADDRAGMAVLLHLIRERVPGTYIMFVGEERGRKGSEPVSETLVPHAFQRMICFDRYGKHSIISAQCGQRTASVEFVEALASQYKGLGLQFKEDEYGSYTDSYSFVDVIPECTNISVGYSNAHTNAETQDLKFLVQLAEASVKIDWESLPSARDVDDVEWVGYGTTQTKYSEYNSYYDRWDDDDYYVYTYDVNDILYMYERGLLTRSTLRRFVAARPQHAAELLAVLLTEVFGSTFPEEDDAPFRVDKEGIAWLA